MASNRSRKCWGRRPHFPFGGLLTTAETERWILYGFASYQCGLSANFLDKLNSPVSAGTSLSSLLHYYYCY